MTNKEIYEKMSLEEKAKLFTGKTFWELEPINGKSIFVSDGPHGIRKEITNKVGRAKTVEAICYPAACLSACSFDKELFKEYGKELGKECINNDIDILLGPGTNIKRNPLCGRNFEYFSEDPFLAGHLASGYIQGVQSKNVGVSLKHFALNSQEQARFVNDSIADERTIREIYLKAFEIAIKEAKPWTIMASYNLLNGTHTTQNEHLLTTIGRKEFGFDGIYMSDWGALYQPIEALKAGLDLEMPGVSKGSAYRIYQAIQNKELDEEVLNDSSKRMIDLYLKTSQPKINDFDMNHGLAMAKRINDESIVLLKNEFNILPINKKSSIALIGAFAKEPRIQGGGSSLINAVNVTTLYDEFKKDEEINFTYAKGYSLKHDKTSKKLLKEAVNLAKVNDIVVIMCGLTKIIESEGYDRSNLSIPQNQLDLINAISEVNPSIVLVLQNGSPIEMPFVNDVKGILETYLGGSMHAASIKDILFGNVNPSGRLAETFPLHYEDVISSKEYLKDPYYSLYKESIYVGYRYYDRVNCPVLYPFGYGLSYSKVIYSNFKVKRKGDIFNIDLDVTNKTNIPCKEVIQIYVGQLNPAIFKAKKELKTFTKIALDGNETKHIELTIPVDELRYYSNQYHKWQLEEGTYRFYLAKHALDESNYLDIKVDSTDPKEDLKETLGAYYHPTKAISDNDFETLLGRKLNLTHEIKPYNLESPIKDLQKHPLGWFVFGLAKFGITAVIKDKVEKKCYLESIPYQPLRSLQMIAPFSKENIDGLVDIFNNHPIKGLKKLHAKIEKKF